MNIQNIIKLSKSKKTFIIDEFKKAHQTIIDKVQLSEIIEIPYRGNYELDMVFSSDKKQSIELFLFKAIEVLEYEASEEIIFYKFQEYLFDNMLEELCFPDTKKALVRNNISKDKCISIIKLKEKDELTFLVETKTNYVFISEDFWKS